MLPSTSYIMTALAVLSSSIGLVSASPVPTTLVDKALAMRGPNEALYLANCNVQAGRNVVAQSQMVYYSNGKSGSQNGEQPNDVANFQNVVQWEGRSQTATFGSGASATSSIRADAKNYGTTAFAGTARNSFGQNFNCFKDNGRTLYSSTRGTTYTTCYSIYYCFDA